MKAVESEPTDPVDAGAVCEKCGNFGALEIGERKLCADCVTLASSSCAGSADEDGGC